MACFCSQYNVCSDWLITGHYSPILWQLGRLQASKNRAENHIINNLLTLNIQVNRKISNLDLAILTLVSLGQYSKVLI